jgi:hypothetical protein
MAEYIGAKDYRDRITVDPSTQELERQEEALFLSAKSGSLFLPDMTRKEWARFVKAATLEEEERRAGVAEEFSELTKKQRLVLEKAGTSIKSKGVRKVIAKREELMERLRPQCSDVTDEVFEKELLEELGMTAEEFKQVDTKLGQISETQWQELEKANEVLDMEED